MPTQRLTIQEAAAELGLSEVTVRRRLKAGQLNGEQEETAQGYRWIVILDTPEPEPDGAGDTEPVADQPGDHSPDHGVITATHEADQRLVTELQDRIAFLERQFDDARRAHDRDRDDWSEERAARAREIERLHTLLAQEQKTVQILTNRLDALPAPSEASSSINVKPQRAPNDRMVHHYGPEIIASLLTIGGTIVIAGWANIWGVMQNLDWQNVGETSRLVLGTTLFLGAIVFSWTSWVRVIRIVRNRMNAWVTSGDDPSFEHLAQDLSSEDGMTAMRKLAIWGTVAMLGSLLLITLP